MFPEFSNSPTFMIACAFFVPVHFVWMSAMQNEEQTNKNTNNPHEKRRQTFWVTIVGIDWLGDILCHVCFVSAQFWLSHFGVLFLNYFKCQSKTYNQNSCARLCKRCFFLFWWMRRIGDAVIKCFCHFVPRKSSKNIRDCMCVCMCLSAGWHFGMTSLI